MYPYIFISTFPRPVRQQYVMTRRKKLVTIPPYNNYDNNNNNNNINNNNNRQNRQAFSYDKGNVVLTYIGRDIDMTRDVSYIPRLLCQQTEGHTDASYLECTVGCQVTMFTGSTHVQTRGSNSMVNLVPVRLFSNIFTFR